MVQLPLVAGVDLDRLRRATQDHESRQRRAVGSAHSGSAAGSVNGRANGAVGAFIKNIYPAPQASRISG
jgi:hypothetical protein